MSASHLATAAAVIAASTIVLGCSTRDSSRESSGASAAPDSAATSSPASRAVGSGTASSSTTASGDSIVRGTLSSVSDSALSVSTPGGDVRIALAQPVTVYARRPADLSRVTDSAFVGVTSVPQPDGTQRATEIHIFPEELRGLGEGSRPMSQPGGGNQGGGGRSTMTNGSIATSRMTNGTARATTRMTNGAARMTNGTGRGAAGGTITVAYRGGSQTIAVPAGVTVTAIARTTTRLAPGTRVIVLAARQPDGTLKASRVMLAGDVPPAR